MDLNLLPLFLAVAEASSFSVVARQLGLRRSSVSRSIAALERSLGVQLFSRTTRHVALTTAGAALHAKLTPQLAALTESLGALPEQEEQPSGVLRLTAPHDIGVTVLPEIVAGFSARYPSIQLDVRLTNRFVDLVAEGFDAALRIATGKLSGASLVARRLTAMEMQVYASPAYLARAGTPRNARETADHQWVGMRGVRLPSLPAPRVPLRVVGDDIMFLRGAAKAGLGLAILPTFLLQEDLATGRLQRVLPRLSVGSGSLYLVHPPTQHVPRKVTAFRDHLLAYFVAHPLASPGPGTARPVSG
jgi:DNA-binding transcriptional LysR family regulator